MQFELLMCLLLHVTNGNMTFVKEYTTAEIICPFKITEKDNVSWYYEENKPIVIMNVINPEFKFKYSINSLDTGELSINIYNFTKSDVGKYSCQGIVGGEHKEGTVTVSICRMSDLFRTFSHYINVNLWKPDVRQRHDLCADSSTIFSNRSDIDDSFNELFKFKYAIKLTGLMETTMDKLRGQTYTYICFTVNDDQCIIIDYDSEFYIKVEWISGNETTKEIAANETQLNVYMYSCKCNISTEELPCNETMYIYYSNKTVYLRDPEKYAKGTFECVLVEKDDFEKTAIPSDIEFKNVVVQVYKLIGITVVCGVILVGVLIWRISRALTKVKNNADNIARLDESQNCPAEGYSSIDRRHRIEVGQMVSYEASRVSRSCIANESRHGLVYMPTISSDGRKGREPKETNGDDNLTVPGLTTSGQNVKFSVLF